MLNVRCRLLRVALRSVWMTPAARRAFVRGFLGDDLGAIIDWAVQSVLRGVESPAVTVLAGLTNRAPRADIDRYFRRALEELDETPGPNDEELLRYAADLSALVLQGELSGRAASREIAGLWKGLNYPRVLLHWSAVDDEYYLADSGYSTADIAEGRAHDAARELISIVYPQAPS